ncbi:hypothetical protein L486_05979 [Kwoniella mangroviensis CBS 10435]|uniref:Uncharacterized protein n=1 Tax=Kwoniella mangroviensis CBS 10435 TaxID=1331196 RepID=A0A1B9IP06_9TREE|nr:hypothetical protein L486_05979 [Kwoniella mangroviensis CBS 10435]
MPELRPSNDDLNGILAANQSNPSSSDTQSTHRTLIGRCRFLPDGQSSYFTLRDALTADEEPDVNLGPKNHDGIWSGGNLLITMKDETGPVSDSTNKTVKSYQGLSWDTKHVRGGMYAESQDGSNIYMGRAHKDISIVSKRTLLDVNDLVEGYHWVNSNGLDKAIEELDEYEYYEIDKILSRASEWNGFYNSKVDGGIEYEPAREEPVQLHGLIVGQFSASQGTEVDDTDGISGRKTNRQRIRQVDEIDLDYEIVEN